MDRLKKILLWIAIPLLVGYIIICSFLYYRQENIIFQPHKLDASFEYKFDQPFEELFIPTRDGQNLNALLFKADSTKGLVFFLHGNGGALDTWGRIHEIYTDLGYDILLLDYKGYGKNKGEYNSQTELFDDMDAAYSYASKGYDESKITLIGYSLGTGIASYLAANNNPEQLILLAPYSSLIDLMSKSYPFVPTFILKYKLNTLEYIQKVKAPVTIFQGKDDHPKFVESSVDLKPILKAEDNYIVLENQGHNGINYNSEYQKELKELLSN